MNSYYVYKHTFSNGTVYYGKGSKNRINSNKRNRYWKALYNKYGEPVREYLNTNISEDMAFTIEEAYIHAAKQLKIPTCNISTGGEASASGYHHTKKAKLLISSKLTGIKKSPETKQKMSRAKKSWSQQGRAAFNSAAHTCNKKPILQLNKCNEVINEFSSIQEATSVTKVNTGNISSVCKGKLKSAGGFHWKYK